MNKTLDIGGFGKVMINPLNIVEKEFETCDPTGQPLTSKVIGTRAKTVYVTKDGVEVPNSQVCKKFVVEDEELICPKFKGTSEVLGENVEVVDDNGLIYSALDRRFYSATTDNSKIQDLVLKQNKTLKFPITFASGWKIWQGMLTNWNGKLLLVACRGDLVRELEKYTEDTVELEIEVIPQQKNMKKLVKAMAML